MGKQIGEQSHPNSILKLCDFVPYTNDLRDAMMTRTDVSTVSEEEKSNTANCELYMNGIKDVSKDDTIWLADGHVNDHEDGYQSETVINADNESECELWDATTAGYNNIKTRSHLIISIFNSLLVIYQN